MARPSLLPLGIILLTLAAARPSVQAEEPAPSAAAPAPAKAPADSAPGAPPATTAPAAPATAPADPDKLPFVHLNRQAGWVELDAEVATRAGDWLELLACTPKTREYESILAVQAKPSHIHLALILLGLTPGHPLLVEKVDEEFKVTPPAGPQVLVSFILEEEGKTREVPAGQWVLNQKTRKPLDDSVWLFAGSKFQSYEGKDFYAADVSGSVLSLVNFGDDVLTRPTTMTNQSDDATWAANTQAIPPVGAKLRIRLKPLKDRPAATGPPAGATQPAGN